MKYNKKNPTVAIGKDIHKAVKRNCIRLERLRTKFKREYEHSCKASPEDGCQTCVWIADATYTQLLAKIKEFDNEKDKMRLDHLDQEYEPPTPSSGREAKESFEKNKNISNKPF